MAKDISFHYDSSEKTYSYGDRNREFFGQFPNVRESQHPAYKNKSIYLGGDSWNYFVYAGGALLSSATMAAAVKAWIEGRRRKIVIEIDGTNKKVEYEGPDFPHDVKEIEAMIDKLAEDSVHDSLRIRATEEREQLPENVSGNDKS